MAEVSGLPEIVPGAAVGHKPYYLKRLAAAAMWQDATADYFGRHGLPCAVFREAVFPREEMWDKVRDMIWDVKVLGKYEVEVRALGATFTTPETFPFDPAIADPVDSWEKRATKPFAIVNISKPTGCAIFIPVTPEAWIRKSKFDSVKEFNREFYWCKKSDMRPIGALVEKILSIEGLNFGVQVSKSCKIS